MVPIADAASSASAPFAAQPIATHKLDQKILLLQPGKFFYTDVVFGSPSMDCNGTGICKISGTNALVSSSSKKDCRATSCIAASSPSGGLALYFFRELLCVRLYRQHFHKGILTVSEPCPVPADFRQVLGIAGKQVLPGRYAVVEREGYCRVEVDCR